MPITVIGDSQNDFPEQIRPQAVASKDGKWVLDAIPDGWGLDHITGSRAKQTKAEQELRRQQERLKDFVVDDKGTIPTADEFRTMRSEYQSLKETLAKTPNAEELRKQLAQQLEAQYAGKIKLSEEARLKAEQIQKDAERTLERTLMDGAIDASLAEARAKPEKLEMLRMYMRERVGLAKQNGKYIPRIKGTSGEPEDWMPGPGQDGYLPPKDYVLNVLRTQQADMFDGEGTGGAGAGSSSGGGRPAGAIKMRRSDINGNAAAVQKQLAEAAKQGKQVVWVD